MLALIAWIGIEDPLYSLVAFHSLFNLLGLCLFVPFIGPFAGWLQQRFDGRAGAGRAEPSKASVVSVSDAAIGAVEAETANLIERVIRPEPNAFRAAVTGSAADVLRWVSISRRWHATIRKTTKTVIT